MIELTWSKDWEQIRREFHRAPFVAIDPGAHGAGTLVTKEFHFAELFLLKKWKPHRLSEAMAEHGARVLVMESQYMHRNAQTALKIGYGKGLFLGELSAYVPELVVVHVTPAEWQSEVLSGAKGRDDLARASGNVSESLLQRAGIELPPMNKADLTGVHDAVCIAQWFAWNTQEG